MKRLILLTALVSLLATCRIAAACDGDGAPIFSCEAAKGRKFIELCADSPVDGENGYLQYRFGTVTTNGEQRTIELEYPAKRNGSLKHFFGATYTHKGIYTQSVRFVSAGYSYTVFTRTQGHRDLGAGVEVRNQRTGKTVTVECSERPRFYIFELKGVLACDPETEVGTACIQ